MELQAVAADPSVKRPQTDEAGRERERANAPQHPGTADNERPKEDGTRGT